MSRASINDLKNHPLGSVSTATLPPVSVRIWGLGYLVDRLGICECRRRVLHMLPGLLPALLLIVPHTDPWGPSLIGFVVAISIAVVIYAIRRESDFARPHESQWHQSVLGYTIPVVALLLLLPGRSEIGLMTLGILAFGDGSATAFGKMLRGPVLPWNRGKTWAGFLAFIINGSLMSGWIYWGETQNPEALEMPLSLGRALLLTAPAVVLCAIVESVPSRINDNISVGVVGAVSLLLLSGFR